MRPSPERRVAAVVVNHNAGETLLECVRSLRSAGLIEIVVVDNASSDGSLERLADDDAGVVLLPTGENLGYGAATNRGVRRCVAPYVLICNPDLTLDADAPRRLADALDAAGEVAVCGPTILAADGTVYPSVRAFPCLTDAIGHAFVGLFRPDNPWTRRYRLEEGDANGEKTEVWLSGACMLVRRLAFASIDGFDPGYFMYAEDLDLCWRLRRAGWGVRQVTEAVVVHAQGVSASRHPYRMIVAHHRSTWRFARRSTSGPARALLPVIGVGLGVRLSLALARKLQTGGDRARRIRRSPAVG